MKKQRILAGLSTRDAENSALSGRIVADTARTAPTRAPARRFFFQPSSPEIPS